MSGYLRRNRRKLPLVPGLAALALLAPLAGAPAEAHPAPPPRAGIIGRPGLPETRVTTRLAPGVTLTRINLGEPLTDPKQIPTTQTGPWSIDVLRIDPRRAAGQLRVTDGPTIAATETTADLVRYARGLAGVNASFFTFTASARYPGDPVGLAIRDGVVTSEPTTDPREWDLVFDSASNRSAVVQTRWSDAFVTRGGTTLALDAVDHPPAAPAACATLTDPARCDVPGQTVEFTSTFDTTTPDGPGAEVVLDRHGCVAAVRHSRGVALTGPQVSIQATGSNARALLAAAPLGRCGHWDQRLTDRAGTPIPLRRHTFAVNGRVRLVAGGRPAYDPAPAGDSFYARNPRTIAGRTASGQWVFVVIDGRSTSSVGATIPEAAQVAIGLGLTDAINLDGGGSSTLVARGQLINRPQGGTTQRKVGDALVWVPAR